MAIKMSVTSNAATMNVASNGVTMLQPQIAAIYAGGIPYTGEYDVIPKTYDMTTLSTKYKTLAQDVTVQKIPQFLVSNDEGGKTLIIGDEYYG